MRREKRDSIFLISNDKQGKINVDRNAIIDDACHHVNIDVRNAHANSTCSEFFSLLAVAFFSPLNPETIDVNNNQDRLTVYRSFVPSINPPNFQSPPKQSPRERSAFVPRRCTHHHRNNKMSLIDEARNTSS